jgi:Family of unknown function (DUF6278)
MRQSLRRYLRGPKHGIARGVVVHGSPGFRNDSARLTHLLADCRNLRAWAQQHEVNLDASPDSLAELDHALSPASEDMRRRLDSDCGLYLGTVIVQHQHHAKWHIWPNGHPVVRLASGRELDVLAAVHDPAPGGQSRLTVLYADAGR